MSYTLFMIMLAVAAGQDYASQPPVWLTSPYFRAGNEDVIATLTGKDSTPTYTFTFSSPLPGVPNLAYGIKNYIGNDYMGNELFEIRREDLTASTFRVSIQIFKVTNIHILNVPYIAIDPTFPHHLNSFDNVPVNYGAGNLVNLTAKSKTQVLSYENTINYTQQAASRTYKTFQTPLDNNKILLYICAIEIYSSNEGSSSTWFPIDYRVNSEILSSETYRLSVTLSNNTKIDRLHFSQIIFDVADVQASNKYFIVTEKLEIPQQGQFIPIPAEFVDNFIMGLLDFTTLRGESVLQYNWDFKTVNGEFGALVEASIPLPHLTQSALVRQGTMVFYIKTWQCPAGYDYFNLTSNLCQDMCADYFFGDNSSFLCEQCSYSCENCTSGSDCTECDESGDHRVMVNEVACVCIDGYYEDPDTTECRACSDQLSNCTSCFYNSSYQSSDADSLEYGCFECESQFILAGFQCVSAANCSALEVLNADTNACEPCLLQGCLNCSSHTVCEDCDEGSNYFLSSSTQQCDTCPVTGCDVCATIASCSVCKSSFTPIQGACVCLQGTYYSPNQEACVLCSSLCLYCNGPTAFECTACKQEQHRQLIGGTCVCDPYNYQEPATGEECEQVDKNKCDRGYVKVELTGQCVELCGDGVLLEKECDDGNIINGDGCSDQCRIQPSFACSQVDSISVCRLRANITLSLVRLTKDYETNSFEMEFALQPETTVYNDYVLESILSFLDQHISISQARYEDGRLIISADYFQDLEGKSTSLEVKEEERYSPAEGVSVFESSKVPFNINVDEYALRAYNNLDLLNYSPSTYEEANRAKTFAQVLMGVGFFSAFIMVFVKRSLSTLVILTNAQVIFYGLTCIDGLHPITYTLMALRPLTGYNNQELFEGYELGNRRVRELGYDGSFANNFNAMLFIELGFLALSGVLFLAAQKKPDLRGMYKRCQKIALLVVLFCCASLFYSLALERLLNFVNVCFTCVAVAVVVGQLAHVLKYTQSYYGMVETLDFKGRKGRLVKPFLLGWVIGRMGLIFCVGLILHDTRKSCIGALSLQSFLAIFLCIGRPFIKAVTNAFVILGEFMSLFAFITIYVFESAALDEAIEGWILLGLVGVVCGLLLADATANIYFDCGQSKVVPEKDTKVANESIENLNVKKEGPIDLENYF